MVGVVGSSPIAPTNSLKQLRRNTYTRWSYGCNCEIERRFGAGSDSRVSACAKLRHLHELAERTGRLERFLVFGSFVSAGADPRDADIVLTMAADFRLEEAPRESVTLFSHPDAEARFGASVFWIRQGMLPEAAYAGVPRDVAN